MTSDTFPQRRRVPIPFDTLTPEILEQTVLDLLARDTADLPAVLAEPDSRKFLERIDGFGVQLGLAFDTLKVLESVAGTPEVRAAYARVQLPITEFRAKFGSNPDLLARVERADTDTRGSRDADDDRFIAEELKGLRRSGAQLPPEKRERLVILKRELSELGTRFTRNVVDSANRFEYHTTNRDDLAGLPERIIEAAAAKAAAAGREGYLFGLQIPTYMAVMCYAENRSMRETFWRAYFMQATEGESDNTPVLARMLELRKEWAELLGYRDFSEFVLTERMVGSAERAKKFLTDLSEKIAPRFEAERSALLEFHRASAATTELEPWDAPYYVERLKQQTLGFDDEELRPYFPVSRVLSGLFELLHRIYGVTIREAAGVPVYEEGVRAFEISDGDGTVLGITYLDLYPRSTKRPGAWLSPIYLGGPDEPHLGLVAHNATAPVGSADALFSHREVLTVFHEFGHLMHHMFSEGKFRSLGGISVAWDFVELPSQLLENWCWERPVLDLIARHVETGETIPEALYQKLLRSRDFMAGTYLRRQIGMGLTDLALHTGFDPSAGGAAIHALARSILVDHSLAKLPDFYPMLAHFNHLFSGPVGYAAGYYSYLWAQVLDADAFTAFRSEGLFSRETGERFRRTILSRGNQKEAGDLFKDFMGRDPDLSALLSRYGV